MQVVTFSLTYNAQAGGGEVGRRRLVSREKRSFRTILAPRLYNATVALAAHVQGQRRRRAQVARQAPAPAECVTVYPPMWLAAMQAATIETAITGAPPPPPPEYAWMLRTWLQCRECVRAVADCHAQQRELLDAAASVPVEDIAGAIRDHLAEDDFTLDRLSAASQRARRRRAEGTDGDTDALPQVVQDQINQILNALGLTLADVKVSVDGDTTTVQIAESVASLADVKEAVSAGGGSGIVTDVSNGEVIVYPPSPPPPSPPPLPPPSPSQPPPTPPPPSACSNPCRKNADGIQLTCLHWSDLSLKVACIYSARSAPFTHHPLEAQGVPTYQGPHGAPEAS